MRIDSRIMPWEIGRWSVWHVERCCRMPWVIAVDDESATYTEQYSPPLAFELGAWRRTSQARRILILFDVRTILINPLGDAEMLESEVEEVKKVKEVERASDPA